MVTDTGRDGKIGVFFEAFSKRAFGFTYVGLHVSANENIT